MATSTSRGRGAPAGAASTGKRAAGSSTKKSAAGRKRGDGAGARKGPPAKSSSRASAQKAAAKRPAKRTSASKAASRKGATPESGTRSRTKAVARSGSERSARRPGKDESARAKSADPSPPVAARLAKYRAMRDFGKTPEPAGGTPKSLDQRSFVIQKHAASHLHYDFRLELDGVLLSWSVPKGPSLRSGERRLAVRTEDHPLDYADFEGIIPKGEYGGGTVIVWDRGTWTPEGDPRAAVRKGRITFTLAGEKLAGRFHLARTKLDAGKREHWLLFKGNDDRARADSDIVSERPESALSGRTIEQVAATPARVWHSNRTEQTEKKAPARAASTKKVAAAGARASAPSADATAPFPAVASLVKRLPLSFTLTNLDKVLYPEQNLRKAELIAYYAAVASYMLPHVGERPLTLVRCPHGRAHKCFYQKHANDGMPAVVKRVPIHEEKKVEEYMTVDSLEGLVALAQMGVLEIHTWTCHTDEVERPDQFVFDIDPDEGLPWDRVVEAALVTRARLHDLGLDSFLKTTGGKGLHVVVPVAKGLDWEQHKEFSRGVAESIARDHPGRYLTNMRKSLRKGKIFLDYLRNGRGATAIAPYSTRAREGATVATPLAWDELEQGAKPSDFTLYTVAKRLGGGHVDPWRDYAKRAQVIRPEALKRMGVRR